MFELLKKYKGEEVALRLSQTTCYRKIVYESYSSRGRKANSYEMLETSILCIKDTTAYKNAIDIEGRHGIPRMQFMDICCIKLKMKNRTLKPVVDEMIRKNILVQVIDGTTRRIRFNIEK